MKKVLVLLAALALGLYACGPSAEAEGDGSTEPEMTWQDYYDLGQRYLSDGNYEEAIIAFTVAIEIDPKQVPAYVGRGDAYVLSGEAEENLAAALADYEKAIELDETSAEAYLGLVDVYIRQGNYEKAWEILKEGFEKTDGDQSILDKIAELKAGRVEDSSGHLRCMSNYNSNGELTWYHIFGYNEKGQQSSVTAYDAAGNQIGYMEFSYDEEGRILRQHSYLIETGELDGYTTYEYDSNGNLVKSEYAKWGKEPCQYETFEYNSEGMRIKSSRFQELQSSEGSKGYYLSDISDYDELGNISRVTWYDFDGNESGYYIYEYDSDGKLIQQKSYDANGKLREFNLCLYDEDGKYIGQEYYDADGNLKSSTQAEF